MAERVSISAGRNIAMKVPTHLFEATVHFYRDVIGLKEVETTPSSIRFEFGSNFLWIDRVSELSRTETWLELITNDLAAASEHFKAAGVVRCDEVEPLPDGFQAFWISSPASVVHLVCHEADAASLEPKPR